MPQKMASKILSNNLFLSYIQNKLKNVLTFK